MGPSVFSVYINDICGGLKCDDFLLFSDEIKIFREVVCVQDQLDLQNDPNSDEDCWCRSNIMDLNARKCVSMTYLRCKQTILHYYVLLNLVISTVDLIRD